MRGLPQRKSKSFVPAIVGTSVLTRGYGWAIAGIHVAQGDGSMPSLAPISVSEDLCTHQCPGCELAGRKPANSFSSFILAAISARTTNFDTRELPLSCPGWTEFSCQPALLAD
jgi:hypothetical protein